ncbi:hypothetical protein KGF54_002296 [Candida jiufengensis]|uniref:uncharacterized protein n=1 Tax=Candida jiufengensis TaxID=497108 RepID=UPI0022247480|nr:uncharacterized protein KGF54_002296 [Candida jiufengensis]KAI5954521.1 hypothetical protein KGF54_002296 [Candida jiufengensis]
MNFLTLSSETSEPFIIPNVSPVSSPKLNAKLNDSTKQPIMGTQKLTPLVTIEDDNEEDSKLISTRKLSDFELN